MQNERIMPKFGKPKLELHFSVLHKKFLVGEGSCGKVIIIFLFVFCFFFFARHKSAVATDGQTVGSFVLYF